MLTKPDLETLANIRIEDATHLLQAGRASSAYYLAGYAVELALKACIAKGFRPNVIPEKAFVNAIYTHSFQSLLELAGLKHAFQAESGADPRLAANWGVASKWTEAARYELWDAVSAGSLIAAIADPQHGVLQWLKKYW